MPATDILGKIGEKVGGQIKALETSLTGDLATKAELALLQGEVDTTQSAAGLGTAGAYTANSSSNYLGSATSLQGADDALDGQVKTNADAISTNASAIDTIEASAGLNSSGVYTADSSADYISSATSLAGADSLLDDQVKTNADAIATNATNITGLDNDKLDKTGGTISSNLTVTGNLTVSGTTTTVNSTEVSVADNNIEVNLSSDGTKTADTGGFNVNRGTGEDKAGLIWNDTTSTWSVKLGSALANLTAGTVTANLTGNVTGNVAGNVTGVVTVPNANGLVVNTTPLGDYSTFESAFNTAIA
jgi:hypothetical protein